MTEKRETFTVFGQRLRIHRYDLRSDIAYVYGWRDVTARPVTGSWIAAATACSAAKAAR